MGTHVLCKHELRVRFPYPPPQYFFKENVMKRKQIAKKRNPFVVLALFKKAGVHRKSNKALRRAMNQVPLGV